MVQIRKAVRRNLPLKMAIHGVPGQGKTYSALSILTNLANGEPVGVIDTENASSEKYAGSADDHMFNFDVIVIGDPLRTDYSAYNPTAYLEALEAFRREGYKYLSIDSLSHLYNWCLDEVNLVAKKHKGNTFIAWNEVGAAYQKVMQYITNSDMNIICTLRSRRV